MGTRMRFFLPSFELARFRASRLTRAAIVVVLIIPAIYAMTFLGANWDPVGNLHRVPAAVVNEDVAASMTSNGSTTTVDAGRDLTDRLTSGSTNFGWRQTSADEADAGLTAGTYEAILIIPRDFSARLATVGTTSPEQAGLTVRTNDATNFISGSVATNVAAEIQRSLRESLSTQTLNAIFLSLGDLHTQLGQAADGATDLGTGADEAHSGAQKLSAGATSLADGLGTADSGATTLATGAASLATGAASLQAGVSTYTGGVDQAAAGAVTLDSGVSTYTGGVDALWATAPTLQSAATAVSAGAQSVSSGIAQVAAGVGSPTAGADPASTQLIPATAALSQGLSQVDGTLNSTQTSDQLSHLVAGSATVATSVSAYTTSVGQLTALCAAEHGTTDPLCQGLTKLTATDNGQLAAGSAQVATGTSTLAGSVQKAGTAVAQLDTGGQKLLAGTRQLATGVQKLADPSAGAPALATGAAQLAAGIGTTSDTAATHTLLGGLHDLSAHSADVRSGAGTLAGGLSTLATNSPTLRSGAEQLGSGATSVADGASTLSSGLDRLADGASTLSGGTGTLTDGLTKLVDGAKTLASKLADGSNAVPASDAETSQSRATATSGQVTTTAVRDNQVHGYGAGLAPFFLCIGLWIGGMVCYMLMRPISPRGLVSTAPSWRAAITGWFPGVVVGTVGALLMWGGLHFGLGLNVAHPIPAVLFTILIGIVFAGIHQAFVAAFHSAGRLFGLVLLILQLGAAGATYPIQTTGPFFEALHVIFPMSYAVNGLRRLIAGGPIGQVWIDVLVLVGVAALMLFITLRACHRQRVWTLSTLHTTLDV